MFGTLHSIMKSARKTEMPEIVAQIGNRLTVIIKEKGLKQRNVAHDSGLDVENLRKYLKGRQEMKISTLLKILNALDISIAELFENLED
jgi:transcriptional regulator with XRE-family HTH domain